MKDEAIQKMKEFFESPEGQKAIKEAVEEFNYEYEERKAKARELVSTTEYIEWAISYLEGKKSFSNDTWRDFFPVDVKEEDRKKIEELSLFFEAIEDYAKKNFIMPIVDEREQFYRIRYNGEVYVICEYYNPETNVAFTKETKLVDDDDIIDFKNISSDTPNPEADEIKTKIDKLIECIKLANKKGDTYQEIFDSIALAFRLINWEETDDDISNSTQTNELTNKVIEINESGVDLAIIERNIYDVLEDIRIRENHMKRLEEKKKKLKPKKKKDE